VTGPSYGELLDEAAHHVAEGAEQALRRFDSVQAARAALDGYDELLAALRDHVAFLLGPRLAGLPESSDPDPRDAALFRLHRALAAAGPKPGRRRERPGRVEAGGWLGAAQALRLAQDILGTHVGPDRQHLTSDAPLLDDLQARWAAATRLAELALTLATAAQPLALRAGEAGSGRRDVAARLARSARAELAPAAGDLLDLAQRSSDGWRALDELTPAMPPAVRASWPPPTADPLDTVLGHLDVLAQAAHAHGRGAPVGAATLQSYAALGSTVCRAVAVVAAAAAHRLATSGEADGATIPALREASTQARAAATSWRSVYQAWQDVASSTPMPLGAEHRIDQVKEILDGLTRANDTWRPAADLVPDRAAAARLLTTARGLLLPLAELASNDAAATVELRRRRDLYVPRRHLPDTARRSIRGAWTYAPAPPDRAHQILAAYGPAGLATEVAIAALAATSGALGTQPRPQLVRAHLGLTSRPAEQLRLRAETQAAEAVGDHRRGPQRHQPKPDGPAP
jgi:hypothetical protein